jgi:hypothetical protein
VDATLWIELAKAAVLAASAGAEVFAKETKPLVERLSQKPRVAGEGMRDELRKIEGEDL